MRGLDAKAEWLVQSMSKDTLEITVETIGDVAKKPHFHVQEFYSNQSLWAPMLQDFYETKADAAKKVMELKEANKIKKFKMSEFEGIIYFDPIPHFKNMYSVSIHPCNGGYECRVIKILDSYTNLAAAKLVQKNSINKEASADT